MATIRLVPSAYTRSSTSRVTVTSDANMYENTDDTSDYCSIRGRNSSSNGPYYCFIHGFNFDDVPSNASVTSFAIKIRAQRNSYLATGSSYRLRLASTASSSSAISNTTLSSDITTTATVYTFPNGSLSWSNIVGYGNGFSIEVPLMSTSNQYPYLYVYGAEIEVTQTLPNPRTITSSLTGNGTIDPSGSVTYYDGDEYTLTVTPTNSSDTVTVKKDGVDITSQLDPPSSGTEENVLGTYTLVSGGFNGSGASYFQGLVGKGVDNTKTTSNYYSSGNGTIAVFTYSLAVDLPANATIQRVQCEVNGHAESTSQSSEQMCVQLRSGNTDLTDEINFKSIGTSNTTVTLEPETIPTVSQLSSMVLQCRLGYYGGAINGATCYVIWQSNSYTYTYIVSGNATFVVTIGSVTPSNVFYIKQNGSWVEVSAVYQKVNGSWVEVSDISSTFSTSANYVKGN